MAKKNPIAAAAKKMAAAPVSNSTVEVKAAETKTVKAEAKAEAPKAEAKKAEEPKKETKKAPVLFITLAVVLVLAAVVGMLFILAKKRKTKEGGDSHGKISKKHS